MNRRIANLLQFTSAIILIIQIFSVTIIHAQNQTKNNLLSVVVMVKGNTINLNGYCIYVKNGKEVKKELKKDNAWGWNFHGDYIKEVKMQRVSGDAAFQLFIMEGKDSASGQPVFESEWVSSTKPVIYKKKTSVKK